MLNRKMKQEEKQKKKIIEYIHRYYNKTTTTYNIYYDSIVDNIFVLICGENINENSFWSCEWLNSWELNLDDKKV